MPISTVHYHYQKYKDQTGDRKPEGENAGRKKCKTCIYRGTATNGCDYIEHTGHCRGCSVEDCDKYERGKRLPGKRKAPKL